MAVLVDGDRALLCHRHPAREWYPDVWDLPGGHIEPGESPAAALRRELHEELGIETDPDEEPLLGTHFGDVDASVWTITKWEGQVTNCAPDEHDDLGWFDRTTLRTLDLADPTLGSLIEAAIDAG